MTVAEIAADHGRRSKVLIGVIIFVDVEIGEFAVSSLMKLSTFNALDSGKALPYFFEQALRRACKSDALGARSYRTSKTTVLKSRARLSHLPPRM